MRSRVEGSGTALPVGGPAAGAGAAALAVEERQERQHHVHHAHDHRDVPVLLQPDRRQGEADQRAPEKEERPPVHQANAWMTRDVMAATIAAPGIVSTHAQTTRPATPHRTALSLRDAPTPTMAPVMVWVVDTGM